MAGVMNQGHTPRGLGLRKWILLGRKERPDCLIASAALDEARLVDCKESPLALPRAR